MSINELWFLPPFGIKKNAGTNHWDLCYSGHRFTHWQIILFGFIHTLISQRWVPSPFVIDTKAGILYQELAANVIQRQGILIACVHKCSLHLFKSQPINLQYVLRLATTKDWSYQSFSITNETHILPTKKIGAVNKWNGVITLNWHHHLDTVSEYKNRDEIDDAGSNETNTQTLSHLQHHVKGSHGRMTCLQPLPTWIRYHWVTRCLHNLDSSYWWHMPAQKGNMVGGDGLDGQTCSQKGGSGC